MNRLDVIKEVLGDKFNPEASYELHKHNEAPRLRLRGHKQVCEVPDSSVEQSGTMLVFEMNPNPLGVTDGDR